MCATVDNQCLEYLRYITLISTSNKFETKYEMKAKFFYIVIPYSRFVNWKRIKLLFICGMLFLWSIYLKLIQVHNFKSMTTITLELGFLGDFVLLLLKTCSLYHEKLFIQKVNDISSQVFNNFFSASDIMEAVRGRFCFYRYECKVV